MTSSGALLPHCRLQGQEGPSQEGSSTQEEACFTQAQGVCLKASVFWQCCHSTDMTMLVAVRNSDARVMSFADL
jgi:hypothetical protein